MIIDFGDRVTLKNKTNKCETVRVTGFWRFAPFSPCGDDFTDELLSQLNELDISSGVKEREERIEPCNKSEAQLISSPNGFHDIADIIDAVDTNPISSDALKIQHEHKIETVQSKGEYCVYGRIKLPVKLFPRYFDNNGQLIKD